MEHRQLLFVFPKIREVHIRKFSIKYEVHTLLNNPKCTSELKVNMSFNYAQVKVGIITCALT